MVVGFDPVPGAARLERVGAAGFRLRVVKTVFEVGIRWQRNGSRPEVRRDALKRLGVLLPAMQIFDKFLRGLSLPDERGCIAVD